MSENKSRKSRDTSEETSSTRSSKSGRKCIGSIVENAGHLSEVTQEYSGMDEDSGRRLSQTRRGSSQSHRRSSRISVNEERSLVEENRRNHSFSRRDSNRASVDDSRSSSQLRNRGSLSDSVEGSQTPLKEEKRNSSHYRWNSRISMKDDDEERERKWKSMTDDGGRKMTKSFHSVQKMDKSYKSLIELQRESIEAERCSFAVENGRKCSMESQQYTDERNKNKLKSMFLSEIRRSQKNLSALGNEIRACGKGVDEEGGRKSKRSTDYGGKSGKTQQSGRVLDIRNERKSQSSAKRPSIEADIDIMSMNLSQSRQSNSSKFAEDVKKYQGGTVKQ